jgi:hypothetical protein
MLLNLSLWRKIIFLFLLKEWFFWLEIVQWLHRQFLFMTMFNHMIHFWSKFSLFEGLTISALSSFLFSTSNHSISCLPTFFLFIYLSWSSDCNPLSSSFTCYFYLFPMLQNLIDLSYSSKNSIYSYTQYILLLVSFKLFIPFSVASLKIEIIRSVKNMHLSSCLLSFHWSQTAAHV